MWAASIVVAANAAYKKENGGWIVLAGLLLSALIHTFLYYDVSVFLSFTIIILCMLYIHTIRIKEQEKSYESSLLRSERLKNELLKKNIQPHYLMNTLTSLIDWVEESPKEGVAFIESLATEFELFSSVADSQLIPIKQEIALCQSHLKIMGYRKEIAYHWEEEGINPNENIPPALLHTLVENGVTHSLPLKDGSVRFKLRYEADKDNKKYELYTLANNRASTKKTKPGTGLAYIKARLSESYGSKWELQSEAINQGWKTSITINT
jgi:sensor histidine kinase YesM